MTHNAKNVAKTIMAVAACFMVLTVFSAPAAHAQADVVQVSELTTPPGLASARQAATLIQESYPNRLQRRGIGGQVVLEFIIEPDGKVDQSSVEVVQASIAGLGDAAKSIVHRIRFTPGEVNGQPVRTQIQFPIEYRAEGADNQ